RHLRPGDEEVLLPATIWGLGNVARAEYPRIDLRLVDLDPRGDVARAAEQLRIELAAPSDARVAYRGDQRFVPAFTTLGSEDDLRCSPDGLYLIAGGTGDLGLHTARW